MMLMLVLLALSAAQPPATAAPAASPPAAAPPGPEGDDTASSIAGLQQMYDQSCAAREYGAYDDLCDQLSQQLKAARVEADREARRKAAGDRRHPRPRPPQPATTARPTTPASAVGPS
jgi:hypothetical protein